jgi:hypothetical protein
MSLSAPPQHTVPSIHAAATASSLLHLASSETPGLAIAIAVERSPDCALHTDFAMPVMRYRLHSTVKGLSGESSPIRSTARMRAPPSCLAAFSFVTLFTPAAAIHAHIAMVTAAAC